MKNLILELSQLLDPNASLVMFKDIFSTSH
jgi:hypothetical protein